MTQKAPNVKLFLRPFWNKKIAQGMPKSYKQMRMILIWRGPTSLRLMGAVSRHHS